MQQTGQPEVLIVGAGPSGLIMAHELLRRRVPVRLIEKRQGPSHTTRAMTVHARSMEMFEHIGMAHRLEEVCLECPGNIYNFPGREYDSQPRTDYRVLPTRFAFYYKINQNDFEQVLREHLLAQYDMRPEYQTECVGLDAGADGVEAQIRLPDSSVETQHFGWVVGCDGKNSFVRESAGIAFTGEIVAEMAMMDVVLENVNFDDRWMNYFFNRDLFMNCTKLPGKNWRLYMSEPTGEYIHAEDKRASFQEVADKIGIGIRIGEPEWATAWEIRNNIAESYRNGRLLICGDASHIHSPSGGQGMNGCMQDAFNLGWKLAAVVRGEASDAILDSYEKERKPIGEQISEGAMATHHIVMGFGEEPEERYHLTQAEGWEAHTIRLVSGLSHTYADNVVVPGGLSLVAGPRAGDRAPDALLTKEPQKRVYDLTRHPDFTVLAIPGKDVAGDEAKARELRDKLDSAYPGRVRVFLVTDKLDESGFDFDHRVPDETGEVRERYEVGDEGRFVLIRPDLYVGLPVLPAEGEAMVDYLGQWFG